MPLLAGLTGPGVRDLTLVFHDKSFVKMKLTFVDGVLAALLLGGLIPGQAQPAEGADRAQALVLPDPEAWRTLSIRYALFFFASAVANEIARRQLSSEHWGMFRFAALGGGADLLARPDPVPDEAHGAAPDETNRSRSSRPTPGSGQPGISSPCFGPATYTD